MIRHLIAERPGVCLALCVLGVGLVAGVTLGFAVVVA